MSTPERDFNLIMDENLPQPGPDYEEAITRLKKDPFFCLLSGLSNQVWTVPVDELVDQP